MKKLFLLSFFALVLPVSLFAQDDDMYFVPTKKNVEKAKKNYGMPRDTYYSGSDRSVDEYNRRYINSTVTAIDSLGNVIPTEGGDDRITLDGTTGVYPDSLEDYSYTRKMSRWDDYEWRDGYHAGYLDGRWGRWGWSSPYYYSSWYGGWYDPWFYDPWYYGSWGYGWYNPWYYGYGWGYPPYWHNHWHGGWYPGGGITVARRSYGTRNHSTGSGNHSTGYNYRRYNSIDSNRGYSNNGRYDNTNTTNRNTNFGGVRNSNGNTNQNNSSLGGTRNNSGSFNNGGSNRGGGGGSFGGGNRGGSGRFGGGRR